MGSIANAQHRAGRAMTQLMPTAGMSKPMAVGTSIEVTLVLMIRRLLTISTNVTSMLVPTAMGLLIPAVGINWVMALPALCCAFAVLPMQFSNRMQPSGANELKFYSYPSIFGL